MRWLPCAIAIIMAMAPTATAQQAPPGQFLITPGVGIGPLRLGMHVADAVVAVGAPKSTFPLSGGKETLYTWFDYVDFGNGIAKKAQGLSAVATIPGEIVNIRVQADPRYRTASGLHTGMSEAEARSVMGEPSRASKDSDSHVLEYDAGIALRVIDDPKLNGYREVWRIGVLKPAMTGK